MTNAAQMPIGGPPEQVAPLYPVVDSDREAAVRAGREWARWTDRQMAVTLAAEADQYPMVQAFARYRIELTK